MIKTRVYFVIHWFDSLGYDRYTRVCRRHVDPNEERNKLMEEGTQLIPHWRIRDVEIIDDIQISRT